MSDRTNVLTVVLDKDYRIDDIEGIQVAIRMIKGVISVEANVADTTDYMAISRAKHELGTKLFEVLKDES